MSIRKGSGVVLGSIARTSTPADVFLGKNTLGNSGDAVVNIHIVIDVTAVNLTPSIQPAIIATDPASGKEYELLAAIAPITAIGTTVLKLGRNVVDAAGLAAQDFIPENVILRFTHADTDSITYSVGVNSEFDSYQ